jgi:3-deoxy-D-manno-octulosonate 8-phosphate phosphatase (KDO 8-P phosphatase)
MNVLSKFKPITTFVFDVDGVLTDGSLLILDDGQWARKMNIKDGYALQLAIKKGYRILVLSGSNSPAVKERLNKLGVAEVFMQVEDKKAMLEEYAGRHQLQPEQILFMGDDIPDLAPMRSCGLPCCPADAVTEIREISQYISPLNGGMGCVRDVIEKVLKLNGHWDMGAGISSR